MEPSELCQPVDDFRFWLPFDQYPGFVQPLFRQWQPPQRAARGRAGVLSLAIRSAVRPCRSQAAPMVWPFLSRRTMPPGGLLRPRLWTSAVCRSHVHKDHVAVRNLFTANVVRTTKSSKSAICAIANGGSFCVGARAFKDGTFSKDCTTRTKTLKYSAVHAAIT